MAAIRCHPLLRLPTPEVAHPNPPGSPLRLPLCVCCARDTFLGGAADFGYSIGNFWSQIFFLLDRDTQVMDHFLGASSFDHRGFNGLHVMMSVNFHIL